MRATCILVFVIVVMGFMLAACGDEATSIPTATPATTITPTATPIATPELTGVAADGHQLFIAKGCSACHGQNAEGTAIAPALSGHTDAMIRRQVRAPVGIMPVFSPDRLSNAELDKIVAYITSLSGQHVHVTPADIDQEVALHHWMALLALESNDVAETIHHVLHINEMVTGDHLAQMEGVLAELEEGHAHDTIHTIEGMLAGTAVLGLTEEQMHLQLALSAVRVEDTPGALHHVQHFLDMVSGEESEAGQAIMDLLEAGDLREAEHELETLLGAVDEGEEHGHDEGKEEDHEHA